MSAKREIVRLASWLLLLALSGGVRAETVTALYRGTAIVTGQENLAERDRGMREALQQVLIKASGDTRLAGDSRLPPILDHAGDYVERYAYEDRLAKKKLMDEQGTRERSYLLSVDFDPAKVDAAIIGLDDRPWNSDRPRLLVVLGIRDTVGPYVLGTQSDRGYGQRETLIAQAARRGIPLALPRMDETERQQLDFTDADGDGLIPDRSSPERTGPGRANLQRFAAGYNADAVLFGVMTLDDDGLWTTRTRLVYAGRTESWQSNRVSFDRAINDSIDRTIRVLVGID